MAVGRSRRQATCVLDNPKISNVHAIIKKIHNSYYLIDQNSTNGTFIDGERIKPQTEIELYEGMEFSLYNERFRFEFEKEG
jgi:pSer/pThr/pTyr-binding forkhead associated (FHA) protein